MIYLDFGLTIGFAELTFDSVADFGFGFAELALLGS
jgi:hypothetical protein